MEKSIFENAIFVGAKIKTNGGEYRIMAIAEGYVMIRKKGCMPFVESKKDMIAWFEKSLQPKTAPKESGDSLNKDEPG